MRQSPGMDLRRLLNSHPAWQETSLRRRYCEYAIFLFRTVVRLCGNDILASNHCQKRARLNYVKNRDRSKYPKVTLSLPAKSRSVLTFKKPAFCIICCTASACCHPCSNNSQHEISLNSITPCTIARISARPSSAVAKRSGLSPPASMAMAGCGRNTSARCSVKSCISCSCRSSRRWTPRTS